MKTGTVRVSEEFIKPDGTKKWFSHEKQYNIDTEDPLNVFANADAKISEYAKMSGQVILYNSQPSSSGLYESVPPGHPPIIQVNPGDREVGVTVESIMSCQDLITLDTYKFLVKSNAELTRAFEVRKEQLTNP